MVRHLLRTGIAVVVGIILVGCGGDNGVGSGGGGGSATLVGDSLTYGNQTYYTVVIGNVRWMAENLNYQTRNSWCYDDNISNCVTYGRLYTWDAAMTACPTGWRLPSNDDWGNLITAVGGVLEGSYGRGVAAVLQSQTGWHDYTSGTNDFNFSALPGGFRGGSMHSEIGLDDFYDNIGTSGYWWSSTMPQHRPDSAHFWQILRIADAVIDWIRKDNGFSVRCVKN